MERQNLIARAMDAGGQLRVRSALNPILWLCAIISLPVISMIAVGRSLPEPVVWLALAPIAVAMVAFVFLLLVDRDKLQSEEYQIRKRSLEIISEKGRPDGRPIDSEILTDNPELPNLGSSDE